MEAYENAVTKESRTEKLLRSLQVKSEGFADAKLPNGYFSHSQYVAWRICGQAYKYRYVDKIRSGGSPAMSRGTSVHSGIEFMLRAKKAGTPATLEQGRQVVSDTFEQQAKEVQQWEEDEPAGKVKDSSLEVFEMFAVQALPKIYPVSIELGFAKKIGDVPMIGWIDLVDEQPAMMIPGLPPEMVELAPKRLVTVDFKTGKAKWSDHELRSDTQLTMYAEVMGTPHVRVDQLLRKMNKGGPKLEYVRGESIRTPDDVAIFSEDLNEVAGFVKAGVFPKANPEAWNCNAKHCAYWSICRGRKR